MGSNLTPSYPHKSASRVRSIWRDWSRRYTSRGACLRLEVCSPEESTGRTRPGFRPTREMPRSDKQAHNRAAPHGDLRNTPQGRVETLSGTTGGQGPGDFRTAPSSQTGAYGGTTLGQVPAMRKKPPTGSRARPARKRRVPAKNGSTEAQPQARRDPNPETRPPAKHAPPAAKRRGRRRLNREIHTRTKAMDTVPQRPGRAHPPLKTQPPGKGGNRPARPRGKHHPRGGKHLGTKDKQARREALKGVQRANVRLTLLAPRRFAQMGMLARRSNRLKKSRRKILMKELN